MSDAATAGGPPGRAEDVQAVHRRGLPPLGERTVLPGDRPQGRVPGQRGPGLPQGRPGRGRPRPARRSPAGPRRPPTTAARCCTGSPSCWRAAGRSSSPRSARPRASRARQAEPWSTPPSTAGSGTPAGPTRSPRSAGRPTRWPGPYFNFSLPEPTGVVAVIAPQASSLLGFVSVVAPGRRDREHGRGAGQRALPAARRVLVGGAGHLRRPGRGHQRADRPDRRGRALARLAHGRQRDRPGRRAGRAWPTTWPSPPPRTSSASCAPVRRTGRQTPGLDRMLAYLETKTVWHPVGL